MKKTNKNNFNLLTLTRYEFGGWCICERMDKFYNFDIKHSFNNGRKIKYWINEYYINGEKEINYIAIYKGRLSHKVAQIKENIAKKEKLISKYNQYEYDDKYWNILGNIKHLNKTKDIFQKEVDLVEQYLSLVKLNIKLNKKYAVKETKEKRNKI